MDTPAFTIKCTGDVCVGDTVLFEEAVFTKGMKAKFLGDRRVIAKITKDSYGADKQQHTFSIEVIDSEGHDALAPGKKTRRKGRNVYRNGTMRMAWDNEADRKVSLDEKHARGRVAREARDIRRSEHAYYGYAA